LKTVKILLFRKLRFQNYLLKILEEMGGRNRNPSSVRDPCARQCRHFSKLLFNNQIMKTIAFWLLITGLLTHWARAAPIIVPTFDLNGQGYYPPGTWCDDGLTVGVSNLAGTANPYWVDHPDSPIHYTGRPYGNCSFVISSIRVKRLPDCRGTMSYPGYPSGQTVHQEIACNEWVEYTYADANAQEATGLFLTAGPLPDPARTGHTMFTRFQQLSGQPGAPFPQFFSAVDLTGTMSDGFAFTVSPPGSGGSLSTGAQACIAIGVIIFGLTAVGCVQRYWSCRDSGCDRRRCLCRCHCVKKD